MTTLALGLKQVRSFGNRLRRMIFGKRGYHRNASQQGESFAMKCLSCAPPADFLF